MMGRMYPDAFPRRWPTLQDSILAMFAGGVQGAWYDPSDLATMSQDGGLTRVTASGQPVALILDKRLGLALGPEIFANQSATFDNSAGGATIVTNAATRSVDVTVAGSNSGYPRVRVDLGLTTNAVYRVSGRAVGAVSPEFVRLATAGLFNNVAINYATGEFSGDYVATGTILEYVVNGTVVGPRQLDITSVRQVLGNHAVQTTTGSRPIYRVENYNALTFTRDFTNAAWSKVNANVTANTWVPTSGSPELLRAAGVVITVGQRFTISGTFKPIGNAVGAILYSSQASNGFELKVNLLTGKLISWGTLGAGDINDFAISGNPIDGWTLYASGGISGGTAAQWRVKLCDAAGLGVTANSVDGLQIDGAQLVLGANAFRPYQWVDASGTFDQSQGLRYLEGDGVDDFLRATFTIAQPIDRISTIQQITWTANDQIFGGVTGNVGLLYQNSGTPGLGTFAGANVGPNNGLAIGANGVVTERQNGVGSRLAINAGAYLTGDAGTSVPGGITVGAANGGTNASNFNLYQLIMRGGPTAMADSQIAVCRALCAAKGRVTL